MIMVIEYSVILPNTRCESYSVKMNNARYSDDGKPNDDGGNSNIESVPAQPPRPIIVSMIIAVPRLRIRSHCYL